MKKSTWILIGICVICTGLLAAAAAVFFAAPEALPVVKYTEPEVVMDEAGKIDINTAGAGELEKIPGIGPVLAGRIVAYRAQYGGFREIRDLLEVDGIGEKKLEQMLPYVKISS